ncbi:MAG: polysulfide reductase NrfD [Eggerthellaceae bacterium]|jgi:polysulfide reductase chain C|nr:polysulfide reductase NrfD [Eggerthellaceae bacterium]MDR2716147.1 polysulfide reductase NrfD [Coriobacteriaceae bacterium]
MNKHYWTWPIVIDLFLGGLGGGILAIAMAYEFLYPGLGPAFAMPVLIAVASLGLACFFLVFELGQPKVFLRVFVKATAIIKWGAVLLSLALIAGFVYFLSCLPWDIFAFLVPLQKPALIVAGISGLLVMLYTGIFLASLKPHAFWNSPALPVLFAVSALLTGAAVAAATLGMWPVTMSTLLQALNPGVDAGLVAQEAANTQVFFQGKLQTLCMALIAVEAFVLLLYVFLLRGSGNEVARTVAARWLTGKTAPAFWLGLVVCGLLLPLGLYYRFGEVAAAAVAATVLVLAGGCLLRFLVVYADDRRLVPGEKRFFDRLPHHDAAFLTAWDDKESPY